MNLDTLKGELMAEFDKQYTAGGSWRNMTLTPSMIKSFLSQAIDRASRAAVEACLPDERTLPQHVASYDVPLEWQNITGFNAARTEMITKRDKYFGGDSN